MKIESFTVVPFKKIINHFTSSEIKEIKLQKKGEDGAKEALGYIENYITQNNCKIISIAGNVVDGLIVHFTKD